MTTYVPEFDADKFIVPLILSIDNPFVELNSPPFVLVTVNFGSGFNCVLQKELSVYENVGSSRFVTISKKLSSSPIQLSIFGNILMTPVCGVLLIFVPVPINEFILPVPLLINPIEVLLFVHKNSADCEPFIEIELNRLPSHTVWFISVSVFIYGFSFIFIVAEPLFGHAPVVT